MRKGLIILGLVCVMVLSCAAAFARGEDVIRFYRDAVIAENMDVADVVVIGGSATVFGRVENTITVLGGFVILKPGAYVGGDIVSVGGEIIKEAGAELGGRATTIYLPRFIPSFATLFKGGWLAMWATVSVLVLIGVLGLAILLTALMPGNMKLVVHQLDTSFGIMLLWGLLWMVLIVPVGLILAVSIIGVILIPVEIVIVVLALIVGYIAAAIFIGKHILSSFVKKPLPVVDAIVGIALLYLIGFVPVVGMIINNLFLLAGFGAVLTTRFGTGGKKKKGKKAAHKTKPETA